MKKYVYDFHPKNKKLNLAKPNKLYCISKNGLSFTRALSHKQ